MASRMVTEIRYFQIIILSMKAIGRMDKGMEKVSKHGMMGQFIVGIGYRIR